MSYFPGFFDDFGFVNKVKYKAIYDGIIQNLKESGEQDQGYIIANAYYYALLREWEDRSWLGRWWYACPDFKNCVTEVRDYIRWCYR